MKKTVTKKEVERVLEQYLTPITKEPILNELFPPEFKVGDKVKVIGKVSIEACNSHGKVVELTRVYECCVTAEKTDKLAGMYLDEVRHATPEEIAEAEWESGKPYKCYGYRGACVRVASDDVGHFYENGMFEGKVTEYTKYEKL